MYRQSDVIGLNEFAQPESTAAGQPIRLGDKRYGVLAFGGFTLCRLGDQYAGSPSGLVGDGFGADIGLTRLDRGSRRPVPGATHLSALPVARLDGPALDLR